jgi:hypothetical protein
VLPRKYKLVPVNQGRWWRKPLHGGTLSPQRWNRGSTHGKQGIGLLRSWNGNYYISIKFRCFYYSYQISKYANVGLCGSNMQLTQRNLISNELQVKYVPWGLLLYTRMHWMDTSSSNITMYYVGKIQAWLDASLAVRRQHPVIIRTCVSIPITKCNMKREINKSLPWIYSKNIKRHY